MAKQTTLQEVKTRMQEMKAAKAAELDEIQQKKLDAQTAKEAAELAIKDATERMDLDDFEKAKQARRRAQSAIDMYAGRYKQIAAQEYISEEDSDKVIDSLLAYEDTLTADFKEALAGHLKTLEGLLEGYRGAIADTENIMTLWQQDIHANYNTRGAGSYTDPLTGMTTTRSPRPVPVHRMPFTGCSEAGRLGEYLQKEAQA